MTKMEGNRYSLKVEDDAMAPQVIPGDMVLVGENRAVKDGTLVVVLVEGRPMLRRFYMSGDVVTLEADNDAYAPIVTRRNDVHIVGPVVRVDRDAS